MYRRRVTVFDIFGRWGIIVAVSLIACIGSFTARRSLTSGTDFLGGRTEIEYFYKINLICFVITLLAVIADITVFAVACVNKNNSDLRKPAACAVGLIISVFTCAAFTYSVVNIHSDLSSTTIARPSTYVLCSSDDSRYFVGFEDKGEMALIPVTKETFDNLSKGHVIDADKTHSEVYRAIESRNYVEPAEYDSAVSIEYYFNSAMIEKAELLFVK